MTEKRHQADRSLALLDAGGVAQRVVSTSNGTAMTLAQVNSAMLGAGMTARAATKIVATTNAGGASTAGMQTTADYLCDGVADEVQINAALAALPASGGTVLLAEGLYRLAAPIVYGSNRRRLRGMGMGATILRVADAAGAPVNAVIVRIENDYNELSDLTVDGNKANNAGLTGMVLLQAQGSQSTLVERAHFANSAGYGLVHASGANSVIRDCAVTGAGFRGAVLRATTGQPLVVTGLIVTGSTNDGIYCDSGPVALSDCLSVSNGGYGYFIDVSALASLHQCISRNNAAHGFHLGNPVSRALLSQCQSIGDRDNGYRSDASQTMFIGCTARNVANNGNGFFLIGADDMAYGCTAADGYHGFRQALTNRSLMVGCRALGNTQQGFSIGDGSAAILGCTTYGVAASGYGIAITGGIGNNLVDGCRFQNHGQDGINLTGASVSGIQVSNNFISDVSLLTNNGYNAIGVVGDAVHIHGNMVRDPAAGNRPSRGVAIDGQSANSFLGLNDLLGSGFTGEVSDAGAGTRRVNKVILDYEASTDLIASALVGNTWTNVTGDLSFAVASSGSVIDIAVRGCMFAGGSPVYAGVLVATRLLIDGVTAKNLGGDFTEAIGLYGNAFGGLQPIRLENLSIGTHTVRVQVRSNVDGYAYLRASTAAAQEYLFIQVSEYAR